MYNEIGYNSLMRSSKKRESVQDFARQKGVFRHADVQHLEVTKDYLLDLTKQGILERLGHGLYSLVDYPKTENHNVVEVAIRQPKAVLCLASALQFHGIGNQLPYAVWIALPQHTPNPQIASVEIQVVRMNPESLSAGVESHILEGVSVKVFSVAKTIADCLKFRSRIHMEATLEALKEVIREKRATRNELIDFAQTNHVLSAIEPYLEVL